ncbi:MAG: prepilin-type N-terminal cleavage/methylation domain-containing protein [Methylorubrum rhodinum]|uniref:prepilin-type N-terminal cleavage/methylation domain-containing protein n=1 Tax=Methylorubrum rhodinum TaxID=29428 RepID=UPI003BB158BD
MTATLARDGADAAGFSLVEMLVVLAVLGLVAGLAIPAIGTMLPGRRLDQTAAALAGELTRLRAQARGSGAPASLTFVPERGLFVSTRPGAAPIAAGGVAVEVLRSEASRAERGEIRFFPDGSATGGAIRLVGAAGRRTLAISSLTGRVAEAETGP